MSSNVKAIRFCVHLAGLVLACLMPYPLSAQKTRVSGVAVIPDSLAVKGGLLVILPDSFFVAASDTVIATNGAHIRLRHDPYARTKLFYDSLAAHAGRRPLSSVLYRLFVKDNDPLRRTPRNDRVREQDFTPYEGKIVRSIQTIHVPILDGDVNDTAWADTSGLGRWLNRLPQTRPYVLRSRRIVGVGKRVTSRRLADLERLVREFRTIRDARLYVKSAVGTDSIDLVLATQDLFPLRMNIDYRSRDAFSLGFSDRNIAGTAVEAGLNYAYKANEEQPHSTVFTLRQLNMFNSFIDGAAYAESIGSRTAVGMSMERPYLSASLPEIGGWHVNNINDRLEDSTSSDYYHLLNIGAWYGHVFRLNSEIEIIPAIGCEANLYPEGSSSFVNNDYDLGRRQAGFASLNLVRRQFLRTALVRAQGVSEFIPEGWLINMTTGRERTAVSERDYLCATLQGASFIRDAGYFAVSLSAGQYYRSGHAEDRLSRLEVLYYTPLLKWGRIRFRQFLQAGVDVAGSLARYEKYTLQGVWTDAGGGVPEGTLRQSLALRSVFFMPWYLYGFRFSFYDILAMERIGDHGSRDNPLKNYPSVAFGLRVQNDYLAYGALSLQVKYAPAVNGYASYFSVSFRTLVLPLFTGLEVGRPRALQL